MNPSRRREPSLWQRRRLLPCFGALALGALAIPSHAGGLAASSVAVPGVPLKSADWSALEPVPMAQTPADLQAALLRWRQVNSRVAEFPRGHADLLRWESRNAGGKKPAGQDQGNKAPPPLAPLDADEAWQQATVLRPDLIVRPGSSGPENASRRLALIELQHAVRRAWVDAVATQATLRLAQARLDGARLGAELGQRMVLAGNWSQARLLREQMQLSDEQTAWLQARMAATGAREALARLLGLWRPDELQALQARLPANLPPVDADLPSTARTEDEVLATDAQLARQRTETARSLASVSAAQRQRWQQAVMAATAAAPADPQLMGIQLQDVRLLRDHALEAATEADAQLIRAATERRSWARQAWQQLQAAHALALHQQRVALPLRQSAEQETLLRYNGMLQSTWDLLAAARERLQTQQAALDARRQYALALADWQALQAGSSYQPGSAASASDTPNSTPSGGH